MIFSVFGKQCLQLSPKKKHFHGFLLFKSSCGLQAFHCILMKAIETRGSGLSHSVAFIR